MAFATNRVHGLGMTVEEFWNATPREIGAHIKAMERERAYLAHILAALHNGPWLRQDKRPWTPEMFMPNYRPESVPDESWRAVKQQLLAMRRPLTPEERKAIDESAREFSIRQSQAAALQANGGTKEQVIALMEGR